MLILERDRASLSRVLLEAAAKEALDEASVHWDAAEINENDLDIAEESEGIAMGLENLAARIRSLDVSALVEPRK